MIVINMAKKRNEEKREKFIKIMLTTEEYKKIDRYTKLEFQNKSEFIRTAIVNRIREIDRSILPRKEDRMYTRNQDGSKIRKELLGEMRNTFKEHESKDYLIKMDEKELKERKEALEKRKEELEEEIEILKKYNKKMEEER
jgi:hypothetical protein